MFVSDGGGTGARLHRPERSDAAGEGVVRRRVERLLPPAASRGACGLGALRLLPDRGGVLRRRLQGRVFEARVRVRPFERRGCGVDVLALL